MTITYTITRDIPADKLLALYESVGWTNYTARPDDLAPALAASSWAGAAYDGDRLVGLCRVFTDGQFAAFVQDILVHPDCQRHGVGRELLSRAMRCYPQARFVLLTDDEPRQQAFYESLGFQRMEQVSGRLRCYIASTI